MLCPLNGQAPLPSPQRRGRRRADSIRALASLWPPPRPVRSGGTPLHLWGLQLLHRWAGAAGVDTLLEWGCRWPWSRVSWWSQDFEGDCV